MCLFHESSRREWLKVAGIGAVSAVSGSFGRVALAETAPSPRAGLTAADVLEDLRSGNERFVKGTPESPRRRPQDFALLAAGQYPEAAIIACSDSRVPPEILFDQGVGDLFVIRVAGNIIGGTGAVVKGSVEYAVAVLNVPLVVVLGHSECGAVKAAVESIEEKDPLPGEIQGLVDLIKPAVDTVRGKPGNKLSNAIQANVELGVERLKGLEPLLARPVREGKLTVVGATYDLATGRVKWLA